MHGPPLNPSQLRRALSALAALLPQDKPAEMILIGGGAGMLSGLLPDGRQTVDVDVMDVTPPEIFDLCCYHAPRIAEECGISPSWFDATPHTIRHTMLDGWRERTVPVGEFGPLRVRAIARIDLISLKLIAGRERDLNDLDALEVTAEEARFIVKSLPQILARGANPDSVEAALALARELIKRRETPNA
jgi:hypothetical protein